MPATAAFETIVRPISQCFGRATASEPATTPAPSGSTFSVVDERASRRVAANLLIIDEESAQAPEWLRQAFPRTTYRVQVAATGAEGLKQVHIDPPDIILLNPYLPDQSGLDFYEEIRRIGARIPVIFVGTSNRPGVAIEAMRAGAYDYLYKPLDPHQVRRVVSEALEVAQRMSEAALVAGVDDPELDGPIVGTCPAMREVYKAIGRVAAQDLPVLITGESGTGKEVVARAIHQHSQRAKAPFMALNCAAIPENLLESELFGHEKGAFTGADRKRIGKFEQCDGGTLLLDEIGDMPLALQAKMLRVIQEQTFERLGGNEIVKTNVRLISATHRDLKALATSGRFREDLYYRLGVFTIHLPPLRDRGDDLAVLVRHFVRQFSRELGREVRVVSEGALEALGTYPWPGNLRELQSVLKQALLRATGQVLLPAMLPDLAAVPVCTATVGTLAVRPGLEEFIRQRLADGSEDLVEETRREVDRFILPLVMENTRGNQVHAAKALGIARQTLRRRLRDLHITPRFTDADDEQPE
jgi:DNA-binding NtrC family response regulator